jgi:excisionase family DNA binding protein
VGDTSVLSGSTCTTPANMEPLLVDAITAARLLGISPRTLWQLTADGAIRCRRVGRRVLYACVALEEFAAGRETLP